MMTAAVNPTPGAPPGPPVSPDVAHRDAMRRFGEAHHAKLEKSRRRNGYFHRYLARIIKHHVPAGSRVLDVGCASGDMLAAIEAGPGSVGIDINPASIAAAREKYPDRTFREMAAEDVGTLAHTPGGGERAGGFDVIVLSGVLHQLYDLHTALEALRPVCHDRTRILIVTFSRLWHPVVRAGEMARWKTRIPDESWLPPYEVAGLLKQCDFDIVSQQPAILLPLPIPLVSNLANRWLAPLPGFRLFDLCTLTIARMLPRTNRLELPERVSVIVPARNEAGNIQPLLDRLPALGKETEVVFVEGNSTDDTWAAIQKTVTDYQAGGGPFLLKALQQSGKGKGDAVRLGFSQATGEVLMILDADLSVPPEELPRFVQLLARNQCDFANGSRLVYPMDRHAMQFLNMIANKLFGWMFTFLLSQRLRDTLCGTKVLRRADYEKIVANRAYFGDFDPFGDFDLLFGAARLNLKIADVPVHYKQRVYGSTNISRFRHGLLLLRMCGFAARKIRFI
ncbi:MAG TPA: glycosyltransferase [Phycisphaerae bacterium]|nr:glycosyltransferase [Phycisphaerae bacterium]